MLAVLRGGGGAGVEESVLNSFEGCCGYFDSFNSFGDGCLGCLDSFLQFWEFEGMFWLFGEF